jgi:tetratricopeptide (TPR) repeat protein
MRFPKMIVSAFLLSGVLMAQTLDTKQPKLKSQKEQEAVMAIFNATDAAARISAADNLVAKFADSEFKGTALYIATASAEEIGDWEKTVVYADRTLMVDPKNYGVMLMLARGYASKTREFDLDKDEKLGKADKYAKTALEMLKTAPKLRAEIPDADWDAQKKNFMSEAYEAMGMASATRKKYDDSIAAYKAGLEAVPGNSALMTRLAQAYLDSKQNDLAIKTADDVLAMANLNAQVKSIVSGIKSRAVAAKSAK